MSAVEPDWVRDGGDAAEELYGEADALGASQVTLKSRKATQKFVDTKRGQSHGDGKFFPPLLSSSPIFTFALTAAILSATHSLFLSLARAF
jgi:hypothetical protein